MQAPTILLIILAFICALGLATYHYYRQRESVLKRWLLGGLRFLTIFSALVLLINPQFTKNSYALKKANLLVLVDKSSSMEHVGAITKTNLLLETLKNKSELRERFDIQYFTFSESLSSSDSMDFTGKRTNINSALKSITETFNNSNNAVVLITDGNQTYGQDYEFSHLGNRSHLYPIVVGDTTSYIDIRIAQVNTNKYAFLKNQFPVEVQVVYSGEDVIETDFRISFDGRTAFRQRLEFSPDDRSQTINQLLEASATGIKEIKVSISSLENEKNTINNSLRRSIEIIDEKTLVGIISSFKHPDIGALKKAVESNEQREVVVLEPGTSTDKIEELDVFILYQPDRSFDSLYDFLENRGGGVLTITGPETDWGFLNRKTKGFSFEDFGQTEEILPAKNEAFSIYDIADFRMNDFPPLLGQLGQLKFNESPRAIAYQRIKGVDLSEPLFFVIGSENNQAYVLGENIWKWRSKSYRITNGFENFDAMIGKLIFLLSSSDKRDRLQLDYENTYDNTSSAEIRASFFNKTYEFDRNASLSLRLRTDNGFSREIPMLLKGNQFEVDLSGLEPANYAFTITETKERISKSGQFRILDFDLEKQFMTANMEKLRGLARNNSTELYHPSQISDVFLDLLSNEHFIPVQKSTKNVVSLIDFRILLVVMVLSLALEWIIRKYNGLL